MRKIILLFITAIAFLSNAQAIEPVSVRNDSLSSVSIDSLPLVEEYKSHYR